MINTYYQTRKVIKYISEIINNQKPDRIVWLGCSPGFPCVYDYLVNEGIEDIRIFDNDSNKHGWKITPAQNHMQKEVFVEPFTVLPNMDTSTLFFCANTHYDDFVKQLSDYDVNKDKIIDLNSVLDKWMWEAECDKVSNFHQIIGRTLQLEQLKLLKWFKKFCHINGLNWFLGEGTLLGAVRHKGFIPWDDDIDVFMPYDDYLKCFQLFPQNDECYLLDWRNECKYPFQFAKVVEKNTYQIHSMPFGYFTLGCYIDVFPLGGYPSENDKISSKYQRHRELDYLWDSSLIASDMYGDINTSLRESITNEKYQFSFYDSDRVGTMQQIAGNAWTTSFEAFSNSVNLQFEDDYFPCPQGYDEFLTARYGDYMTPPPANKRRIHSYPTYII
ncbi:MAG: LicD family protein [Lachnospiraceae bacterium]|nr:LicD family protein [Lachnospiraceae bacterium]